MVSAILTFDAMSMTKTRQIHLRLWRTEVNHRSVVLPLEFLSPSFKLLDRRRSSSNESG